MKKLQTKRKIVKRPSRRLEQRVRQIFVPTKKEIKEQMQLLRARIDFINEKKKPTQLDLIEARIAYVIETTLIWCTEKTDWGTMLQEAEDEASILNKELHKNSA